jgi:ribosomal protein S18 acetylase RimI-like enzyme
MSKQDKKKISDKKDGQVKLPNQRSLSPRSEYNRSGFKEYDEKYMKLTKAELREYMEQIGVLGLSARSKPELCSMATYFKLSLGGKKDKTSKESDSEQSKNVSSSSSSSSSSSHVAKTRESNVFYDRLNDVPKWIVDKNKWIEIDQDIDDGFLAVNIEDDLVQVYVFGAFQEKNKNDSIKIYNVGVHPNLRGKKLCKPLMKFFMENMIQRGVTSITITVSSENTKAACFCYTKAAQEVGFTKLSKIDINGRKTIIVPSIFCDRATNWATLVFSDPRPKDRTEKEVDKAIEYDLFYDRIGAVPKWIIKSMDWVKFENSVEGFLAVHMRDKKSIAYVYGYVEEKTKKAVIDNVSVHPDFRGRKLCKPLVKYFMQNLIERGVTSIEVLIHSFNPTIACFCYIKAAQEVGFTKFFEAPSSIYGWAETYQPQASRPFDPRTFCNGQPNDCLLTFSHLQQSKTKK